MQTIFNFIFDNFLLVVVIVLGWYIFTQYKDLKEKTNKILNYSNCKIIFIILNNVYNNNNNRF